MNSILILIFCVITGVVHYAFFSILKKPEMRIHKLRIIFCLITAGMWAAKIILSSLPTTFYDFFMTGRGIPRLLRVFLYAVVLLTDYRKLQKFLTKQRILLFLLCPILSYLTLEISIGTNPLSIRIPFLFCNLIFLGLFYLFFFFLTGKAGLSLTLCSVGMLLLSLGNYFVYQFRGRYISYSDIYELTAAAAVVGKYKLAFGRNSLIAVLLLGLSLALIWSTSKNSLHKWIPKIPYRIAFCILIPVLSVLLVRSDFLFSHVSSKPWDPQKTEQKYGYVLSAMAEIHDSVASVPEGYSVEAAENVLTPFYTKESETAQTPNIIVVMNESFTDLSVLGDFETNEDPLPFFHSLSDNCQKGSLITSGIGGGTSYTEFESLSGSSQAFIQGAAYARYIRSDTPTLVSTLKSLPDAYTATAMHPEKAANYYRDRAYRCFGFDETYFIDAFEDAECIFDKVTDAADYEFLFRRFEEKTPGKPALFFNVTMQNHGDYSHTDYTFEHPVSVTSFDAGSDVNEFLSLMRMSDDALQELISYFSRVEEPVLLLFFGDHQPSLNEEFYEKVLGKPSEALTTEEEMKKHMTPFFLWANYDIEEKDLGTISPNLLSPLLLETAGLPLTAYNRYVLSLKDTLPVIQSMGYQDRDGNTYTYDDESPYLDLINNYRNVQYNYLHDKKNRLDIYYYPYTN